MRTYVILCQRTRLLKIGKSENPSTRLKQLQIGSPGRLKIVLDIDGDFEAAMHHHFRRFNAGGEWFYPRGHIWQCINYLQDERRKVDSCDFYSWKKTRLPNKKRKPKIIKAH